MPATRKAARPKLAAKSRGIERANRNPLTTRIEGEIRSGLREMVACQTILGKFVRVKVMLHWGAVKRKVGDK